MPLPPFLVSWFFYDKDTVVKWRHCGLDYMSPILDSLSVLHNFTMESQVLFHGPLAFKPQLISGGEAYGLTTEDLTVFVNSAEWTLCNLLSLFQLRTHSFTCPSFECFQRSRVALCSLCPVSPSTTTLYS